MSKTAKRLAIAAAIIILFWAIAISGLFLLQLQENNRPGVIFGHGVPFEELIDSLVDSTDVIATALGVDTAIIHHRHHIAYNGFNIFNTNVSTGTGAPRFGQTFNISVRADVVDGHVSWTVVSFHPGGFILDAPPFDPDEQIIEEDFWMDFFVRADYWQDDMMRLLYEHGGHRLRGIWLNGGTLVVDVLPIEYFMLQLNLNNERRLERFERTLQNFPGIDAVEILAAGSRETWGNTGGMVFAIEQIPPDEPDVPETAVSVETVWAHLESETNRIADILGVDEVEIVNVTHFPFWSPLDNHFFVEVNGASGLYEIVIQWHMWSHALFTWSVVSVWPFTSFIDTRSEIWRETERLVPEDTFELQVRSHVDMTVVYEVSTENWVDEVIELIRHHSGHRIHYMWLEDGKLYVDMKIADYWSVFDGSGFGQHHGATLLSTLFDLPGVDEIEFLFGGIRRHPLFADIFRADRWFAPVDE